MRKRFVVYDTVTQNIAGCFDTLDQAKETFTDNKRFYFMDLGEEKEKWYWK